MVDLMEDKVLVEDCTVVIYVNLTTGPREVCDGGAGGPGKKSW